MPAVLKDPPKTARNITTDDVARLVTALQAASRPLTAAQLSVFMFAKDTEGNRRRVRAIASAGRPRIVSFPGSNGYTLLERCTQAELKHGIAAIRRQATSMCEGVACMRQLLRRGLGQAGWQRRLGAKGRSPFFW